MSNVLEIEQTTQRPFGPVNTMRPHWSFSQLSQFLRCPLQYFFERVMKLERPYAPSVMVLGSSVHEGLAEYHRLLQAGQAIPAGHVQEAFLNAWQANETRQPIQFKDGEDRDAVLAQGIALLELYLQEPPPQNIVAVEQSMMVPLFTSKGERLRPPDCGDCLILDPCAGEGHALHQLAQGLHAVPYGIELSEDRAAVVRESLPEGQALAPADFLRCAISYRSFSFCWINPPYDYATGGEGRVESQFLEKAFHLLAENGVLALVCPEDVASSFHTVDFFQERFYDVSAMQFPQRVRKYNETIVLGQKRKHPKTEEENDGYQGYRWDWLDTWMNLRTVYKLPAGERPKRFVKLEPTDAELARLVAQSPLRFQIERPADKLNYRPRPPMSPGIGHRAMLLASGHIDGLICPPDETPHVIRGTATKDKYVASCDENEDEDGNLTTRTVISERPRLVIRVLDSEGNITTLE